MLFPSQSTKGNAVEELTFSMCWPLSCFFKDDSDGSSDNDCSSIGHVMGIVKCKHHCGCCGAEVCTVWDEYVKMRSVYFRSSHHDIIYRGIIVILVGAQSRELSDSVLDFLSMHVYD